MTGKNGKQGLQRSSNGLPEDGEGDGSAVYVEQYFGGLRELGWVCGFGGLRELKLVGQWGLEDVGPLGESRSLRVLWLVESEVESVEGLGGCATLEELYLYGNDIQNADCLGALGQLRLLWIARNQLTSLQVVRSVSSFQSYHCVCLQFVTGLPALENLDASFNPITGLHLNKRVPLVGTEIEGIEICKLWKNGRVG